MIYRNPQQKLESDQPSKISIIYTIRVPWVFCHFFSQPFSGEVWSIHHPKNPQLPDAEITAGAEAKWKAEYPSEGKEFMEWFVLAQWFLFTSLRPSSLS